MHCYYDFEAKLVARRCLFTRIRVFTVYSSNHHFHFTSGYAIMDNATFKDVPELFEVCAGADNLRQCADYLLTGRIGGILDGPNREFM